MASVPHCRNSLISLLFAFAVSFGLPWGLAAVAWVGAGLVALAWIAWACPCFHLGCVPVGLYQVGQDQRQEELGQDQAERDREGWGFRADQAHQDDRRRRQARLEPGLPVPPFPAPEGFEVPLPLSPRPVVPMPVTAQSQAGACIAG